MKLFLISLLISIIPGIVIIWPFIFKTNSLELLEKQISSDKKMSVKWETTISKLKLQHKQKMLMETCGAIYRWTDAETDVTTEFFY